MDCGKHRIFDLAGRTAIVTGNGGGIGPALVLLGAYLFAALIGYVKKMPGLNFFLFFILFYPGTNFLSGRRVVWMPKIRFL